MQNASLPHTHTHRRTALRKAFTEGHRSPHPLKCSEILLALFVKSVDSVLFNIGGCRFSVDGL